MTTVFGYNLTELAEIIRFWKEHGPKKVKVEDYQTDLSEYDTILGFLSKHDQFLIDMMEDPIKDTQRDGFWMMHRCRERGIHSIKVPAPKVVTDMYPAIETINAYPISLLKERFGH